MSTRAPYRKLLMALAAALLAAPASAVDLHSYAQVKDDATLRVGNRDVRLFGVYAPPTGKTCRKLITPVRCASRAALALEFKIGSHFVNCEPQWRNADRSYTAVCYVQGQDLGAYLIEQGWAVATPQAPFEYHTLERIARHRGVGVWGFSADSIERR